VRESDLVFLFVDLVDFGALMGYLRGVYNVANTQNDTPKYGECRKVDHHFVIEKNINYEKIESLQNHFFDLHFSSSFTQN